MVLTDRSYVNIRIPAQGQHLKWMHEHMTVNNVVGQGDHNFNAQVIATKAQLARLTRTFPDAEILEK